MQAKYPVKVQAIRSKGRTDRFYVFVPLPLAAAISLEAGESVQWMLTDRDTLSVQRLNSQVQIATREKSTKKKARLRRRG